MRPLTLAILIILTGWPNASPRRANFLHVTVTASRPTDARAVWRPYAGAVGAEINAQQDRLLSRRAITHPDSVRRWADPAARDTVPLRTPTEFVVDMTGGPVVVEVVGTDSVRIEAQLTPARGPVVSGWGRAFSISSDGLSPSLERWR